MAEESVTSEKWSPLGVLRPSRVKEDTCRKEKEKKVRRGQENMSTQEKKESNE